MGTAIAAKHSATHPPLVARGFGPTYREDVDRDFVMNEVSQIRVRLPTDDMRVTLYGFMAPWDPGDAPDGQLCMRVHVGQKIIDFTISFGAKGDDGLPGRAGLDDSPVQFDANGYAHTDIYVANFDECWLLLCEALDALQPQHVGFSFGL